MLIYQRQDQLIVVIEEKASLLPGLTMDSLFQSPDPAGLVARVMGSGVCLPVDMPGKEESFAAPVQSQEVWAAGVTYFRSKVARMDESKEAGASRFYDMVYDAARPEIFFKATARRVRGHMAGVRVRSDSTWSVPEPELALAINSEGRVFGYTVGNDMSARDIEGENPLYLPQAKMYTGGCSLGPCLLLADALPAETGIHLSISRDGAEVFSGSTSLSQLKRTPEELAGWLYRDNDFPHGSILFTGTGLVPPGQWTLAAGDVISITIDGIGTLVNEVEP